MLYVAQSDCTCCYASYHIAAVALMVKSASVVDTQDFGTRIARTHHNSAVHASTTSLYVPEFVFLAQHMSV